MSRIFWNLSKVAPVFLGAALLVNGSPVSAQSVDRTLEQIEQYNQQAPASSMGQVTSVNQLRDVAPTDWSFEALQSLVERYGCIAGFPNQTYRGNKPLSRYEFAAGLNACLNQIERLIASSESVMREDLDKINRLSEEFQAELATLGTRVDNLEGRTAFLEDHQFSTTTKLKGKVIFGLSGSFGQDNKAGLIPNGQGVEQTDDQITFSNRARLNFETSFNGKDMLRTRLQATNVPNLGAANSTGVAAARLGYEGSDTTNDIVLDDLWYKFPVGSKITAWVGPNALNMDDIFETNNPYFQSNETGTVTRFARYNPLIYRTGAEGAGAGAKYEFSKQLDLTLAYLADGTTGSTTTGAANPSESNGLFSGAYTGAAQIGFSPSDSLKLTASYAHTYQPRGRVNLTGGTGDNTIDSQFNNATNITGASADRFGLQASFKLSDRFNIAGWAGYGTADSEGGNIESDIYTAALNLAILDIGKEGSVIGITAGIPPYADADRTNEEIPIFVEGLYKYPINDKISLTPSVYAIFNPNSNDQNDTVLVGTLRTTFEF